MWCSYGRATNLSGGEASWRKLEAHLVPILVSSRTIYFVRVGPTGLSAGHIRSTARPLGVKVFSIFAKSSGSATRHVRYTSQVLLSRLASSGGRGLLLWLQITCDDKITSASWATIALRCVVGYCAIRYVN